MTMTRCRETLRLHGPGNPIGKIAAVAGLLRNTGKSAIEKAGAAGLEWPLPEKLEDAQLSRILYSGKSGKRSSVISGLGVAKF